MKSRLILLLLVFIASSSISQAQEKTLIVFAAASLSDAFTELAETFQAENPDVAIIFNFASSSNLAAQLAEGAPADIFASANTAQMNTAQEAGRIADAPQIFAKNRLVIIVPTDNPANIQSLSDLANADIALIVAAEGVPVREYTNTMLERLAADPAFGEAYRAAFMANIVSEEDNVRQVAAKVALGEADAGLVYISDVTPDIADAVLSISIPDSLNTIAAYPIAITNDSAQAQTAQAFIDFVLSDAGQDILVAWNFISIRSPETPNPSAIQMLENTLRSLCPAISALLYGQMARFSCDIPH